MRQCRAARARSATWPPCSRARRARRRGADVVLTTGKDVAKLAGRLDYPLAVLPVTARPEPAFWRWLDGRLGEKQR